MLVFPFNDHCLYIGFISLILIVCKLWQFYDKALRAHLGVLWKPQNNHFQAFFEIGVLNKVQLRI